ncbi:hypothetical protein BDF21DRAFT_403671 [Thamnidium elegans]|nr:hypothetical protein BDF21DRAFT_403671 [Thamnidium elegans]
MQEHLFKSINNCIDSKNWIGDDNRCRAKDSDFDKIATGYKKDVKGKGKETESSSLITVQQDPFGASSSKTIVPVKAIDQIEISLDNALEDAVNNKKDGADDEEDEDIRIFSASLLSLLRSDLPKDIKEAFIKTLEEKQTSATDYIIDFSKQVYQMITLLKSPTLVKDSSEIVIRQRNGPMIQEILLVNYQLEENGNDFLPSPLDHSCMISKVEEREFSRLFTNLTFN